MYNQAMIMKLKRVLGRSLVWAGIGLLAVGQAQANCSIHTEPVNFGTYDPLQAAPLIALGNVGVNCGQGGGRRDLRIELSSGSSGSYAGRTLRNGTSVLGYNLYLEAGGQVVWGDGTGGSQPLNTRAGPPGQGTAWFPVHARLPPGQDSSVGPHSDTIQVTVIF